MKTTEIGDYIVVDPEICHGQMSFKGTRVPVETVLVLLGKGYPIEQLLKSYPELKHEAIEQALKLATEALQFRYRVPVDVAA